MLGSALFAIDYFQYLQTSFERLNVNPLRINPSALRVVYRSRPDLWVGGGVGWEGVGTSKIDQLYRNAPWK